jgi:hypothetical protein
MAVVGACAGLTWGGREEGGGCDRAGPEGERRDNGGAGFGGGGLRPRGPYPGGERWSEGARAGERGGQGLNGCEGSEEVA